MSKELEEKIKPVIVESIEHENRIIILDGNIGLILDGKAPEIIKKLKALEIIKKVVKYDIEVNGNDIFDIEYEPNEMLSKEEFDLLKEVLK